MLASVIEGAMKTQRLQPSAFQREPWITYIAARACVLSRLKHAEILALGSAVDRSITGVLQGADGPGYSLVN